MKSKIQILKPFLIVLVSIIFSSNILGQDQSEYPLRSAVLYGEIAEVRKIIDDGVDLNRQDENGYTALIHACVYCSNEHYREMAKILIVSGADVNIQANDGNTAIIEAAGNSPEIFNLLLDKGADPKVKKEDGTGAFYNCMIHMLLYGRTITDQDKEIAVYLLSNGANADECPLSGEIKGFTPLIFAARENNEEILQLLIDHGADVNARNMYGDSPLSLAEEEGHSNIVKILKANGAK